MVWQSVPHFIVAQMVGNTLTDGEGKQLSIKPHPALTRLAIAKPTASYKKWLLDPKQHEQFTGVIENTCFRVSKHGQSSALLNAPVEWWLLWGCRHRDPLRVYLLEYDDLTAAQERTIIHDNALRLLGYPLTNRTKTQLGMQWEYFGLTKRDYATMLMGRSEANLHYHLSQVVTPRPKPTLPPPDKLQHQTLIPSVENERMHLDQEPPSGPAELPTSCPLAPDLLVATDSMVHQLNADTDPKEQPLTSIMETSSESILRSAMTESALDPRDTPASLYNHKNGQGTIEQQDDLSHPCPATNDPFEVAQAESTSSTQNEGAIAGDTEQLFPSSGAADNEEFTPSQTNADIGQESLGRVGDEPTDKEDGDDQLQLVLTVFNTRELERADTQAPAPTPRIGAGRRRRQTKSKQPDLFGATV